MSEPIWVPPAAVLAIHDRQIARHGGAPGMRDRALLKTSCTRAVNLASYPNTGLAEFAAAYAFGISKAHAFVDGNKRTAFVTAVSFLRLNGYSFRPETIESVRMMENVATGEVSEAGFTRWLSSDMKAI